MNRYRALQEEQAQLKAEWDGIIAAAEAESRVDLTAEETARVGEIRNRLEEIKVGLAQEEDRRAWERNAPAVPPSHGFHDRAVDRPWGPAIPENASAQMRQQARQAALGELLFAVAYANSPAGAFGGRGGQVDPRLYGAASGLSSGVGADGGFLVGTQMSMALLERAMSTAVLAPRCMQVPLGEGADSLEAPIIDETSRANGSRWGGVRVYRRAEADTVTATKPKFGEWEVRLEDLMAICYATDRSLRDALSMGTVMEQSFSEEFAFKVDDEIIRGSGVGECLGVLNAPAVVSVSKETGQAAATIVGENLSKMWSRMPARLRGQTDWFYNQDCEPTLHQIAKTVGTGGLEYPFLAFAPDGSMRCFGRPMIAIEQAETVGTVGDIMLLALGEYALITKGGIQADSSIHVRFLYGERTFRWIYPINGRPKWKSAVTPYKGGASNTRSPYVVLQTRS